MHNRHGKSEVEVKRIDGIIIEYEIWRVARPDLTAFEAIEAFEEPVVQPLFSNLRISNNSLSVISSLERTCIISPFPNTHPSITQSNLRILLLFVAYLSP